MYFKKLLMGGVALAVYCAPAFSQAEGVTSWAKSWTLKDDVQTIVPLANQRFLFVAVNPGKEKNAIALFDNSGKQLNTWRVNAGGCTREALCLVDQTVWQVSGESFSATSTKLKMPDSYGKRLLTSYAAMDASAQFSNAGGGYAAGYRVRNVTGHIIEDFVWDMRTGKINCKRSAKGEIVRALLTQGGRLLVEWRKDGSASLIHAENCAEAGSISDSGADLFDSSSGDSKIVFLSLKGNVQLWSTEQNKVVANSNLKLEGAKNLIIALSPDAKTLATAEDGLLRTWDVATGAQLQTVADYRTIPGGFRPNRMVYSQDGQTLLAWDTLSRLVQAYDRKTGSAATLAAAPVQTSSGQSVPATSAGTSDPADDLLDWQKVQNSSNAVDFQGYLTKHPDGMFAQLANDKLKEIGNNVKAQAEQAESSAIKIIKVEHDHDGGVMNLLTAGMTIGECYGDLYLSPHQIEYRTDKGSHSFKTSCSVAASVKVKSKYGKNNMVQIVVDNHRYNFFSRQQDVNAAELANMIESTCGK
jgi:WD40 repeat protein